MTDNEPTDIFRERLQAARALRELNQTELAVKAGLPPSSVSHFEGGTRKPSFDNLKRLASALVVTTDYLLGRSESPDASGEVGKLHRDQDKLTDEDLQLTNEFVTMLLKRREEKKETK